MEPQPKPEAQPLDPVTGLILCGGAGKRMGGDKPHKLLAGRPLWQHCRDALAQVCARVLVVGGPPISGAEWIPDQESGLGPLGGLLSGLEAADTEWCLCLAVDLPLVRVEVLRELLRWRAHTFGGYSELPRYVVPLVGLIPQPLLAAYHRECAIDIRRLLAQGERRAMALYDQPLGLTIGEMIRRVDPELVSFRNLNTPEDLAWAEAWLAG